MRGENERRWVLSTHLSSEPKIDSCKKDNGQYEKECQKCYQVHCFSKHCRGQLKLFWLKFRNKKLFGVMFKDNMLQSSDILQSLPKMQFQIVTSFNVSNTMEQFIYYDNKREDIIIIFVTRQSLLFLQNSEDWFVYGTFSTVPPQFLQLYTIHGIHHVKIVVGTYCLLTNKRRETYTEKLRQLKHLINNAIPHSIMIDFYERIIVILNEECHLVQQKVCLFPLSKSIYRHVQELRLSVAASGFLKAFRASHSSSKV